MKWDIDDNLKSYFKRFQALVFTAYEMYHYVKKLSSKRYVCFLFLLHYSMTESHTVINRVTRRCLDPAVSISIHIQDVKRDAHIIMCKIVSRYELQ